MIKSLYIGKFFKRLWRFSLIFRIKVLVNMNKNAVDLSKIDCRLTMARNFAL